MLKATYVPSVYGPLNCQFAGDSPDDVKLCKGEAQWFTEIMNEMKTRLKPKPGQMAQRAVLVFFEKTETLEKFYNSDTFKEKKSECIQISEATPSNQKASLIQQAVRRGGITIANRKFGRGTDFICYDQELLAAGGIHVIQTFVSDKLSEETQIMGRTARQGNTGSFSMVLEEGRLEVFGIKEADANAMRNTNKYYTTIHKKRSDYFDIEYPKTMEHVGRIRDEHAESVQFIEGLVDRQNVYEVREFLFKRNECMVAETEVVGRTIIMMDATCSMSGLISAAKTAVTDMFSRAFAIMGKQFSFEMQMAVYRNYNAGSADRFLEYSGWESSAQSLQQWVSFIDVCGGWGAEAVELALQHIAQEHDASEIAQVILIGDAPAQPESETMSKRASSMSDIRGTKYETAVFFEDQLNAVVAREIKVHTVHLNSYAKSSFEYIAQRTGGSSIPLSLDDSSAVEQLTSMVTQNIMAACAGDNVKLAAKFVDDYKAKYGGRGYVSAS